METKHPQQKIEREFNETKPVEKVKPEQLADQVRQKATKDAADFNVNGIRLAEQIASSFQTKIDEETRMSLVALNTEADTALSVLDNELATSESTETIDAHIKMITETIDNLMEQFKNPEIKGLPKVARLGDAEKIENQQINFFLQSNKLVLTMKLTQEHFEKIQRKFEELGAKIGSIGIPSITNESKTIELCKAKSIDYHDAKIKIFTRKNAILKQILHTLSFLPAEPYAPRLSEATKGLVSIEVPMNQADDQEINSDEIAQKINNILKNTLEIPNALDLPNEIAERDYKLARYCWHHKKDIDSLSDQEKQAIAERLVREEVFPGYYTMVEEGKHKEYQKIAPFAVVHNFWGQYVDRDIGRIASILKGPGLFSRMERYQRGMETRPAVDPDMQTGGADSVFAKLITKSDKDNAYKGFTIIFTPDLLDRSDWYSYRQDCFGSTAPSNMKYRQTPEKMVELEKNKPRYDNELMFRTGIPVKKIAAIACGTEKARQKLLAHLKKEGITNVNGQPIEKFVVTVKKKSEWIDIINNNKT